MKTLAALLLMTSVAFAAEPTLNDIPSILQKLRGCKAGYVSTSCKLKADRLWISIRADGSLTIFYRQYSSDSVYAEGDTVTELLRNFATKINDDRDNGKIMLDAIAPLLPTQ